MNEIDKLDELTHKGQCNNDTIIITLNKMKPVKQSGVFTIILKISYPTLPYRYSYKNTSNWMRFKGNLQCKMSQLQFK